MNAVARVLALLLVCTLSAKRGMWVRRRRTTPLTCAALRWFERGTMVVLLLVNAYITAALVLEGIAGLVLRAVLAVGITALAFWGGYAAQPRIVNAIARRSGRSRKVTAAGRRSAARRAEQLESGLDTGRN